MNPFAAMNRMQGIMKMMQGKDPNAMMQQMLQNNPQFSQFMRENQGKTPAQIAQAYGLDPQMLRSFGIRM